jgi:tetratricopeptide (TPR) repeat protein
MKNKKYESLRVLFFTSVLSASLSSAVAQEVAIFQDLGHMGEIERLEAELGPFDYRLSEASQSMGNALFEGGAYAEAITHFERALHVTRINNGLHSEDQIPLLEKLIDCNISIENWTEVDSKFRYLHFLYTRLYEEGSAKLHHGLAQVAEWHVLAINKHLSPDITEHLREANKLFKLRLDYVEKQPSADDQVVEVLKYNIALTQYHLRAQSGMADEAIFNGLESRYNNLAWGD